MSGGVKKAMMVNRELRNLAVSNMPDYRALTEYMLSQHVSFVHPAS